MKKRRAKYHGIGYQCLDTSSVPAVLDGEIKFPQRGGFNATAFSVMCKSNRHGLLYTLHLRDLVPITPFDFNLRMVNVREW